MSDVDPSKQRVPWYKLEVRPKADRYTMAGAQLILGLFYMFRRDPCCQSDALRYGGTALIAAAAFRFWRAWRMPADTGPK